MLLKINPQTPNPTKVSQVTRCLAQEGVIIIPTDTVYALGCDLMSKQAVAKICQIKGLKPQKANLSLLCADLSHLSDYALVSEKATFRLLNDNLPGPFTFILPATGQVSRVLSNKKKTVGIRIPDNPIAQAIIRKMGRPLITTSLHHEDQILDYMTDPEQIFDKFKKQVDIVVHGGYGDNQPSTVVDCTNEQPRIMRAGKGKLQA